VLAGEKAFKATGNWLPEATLDAYRKYLVGIKGPLTTPIGGGIRSLNVALRQELDLYVCLRPVRYFTGVPTPVKRPEVRHRRERTRNARARVVATCVRRPWARVYDSRVMAVVAARSRDCAFAIAGPTRARSRCLVVRRTSTW